jgi:hypothetical protein
MNTQEAAAELADMFEVKVSDDGREYTSCDPDGDARTLVYAIHQDLYDGALPKDWVYDTVAAILRLLSEETDPDYSVLSDEQTRDLLTWAMDSHMRSYVDEVIRWQEATDLFDALSTGQIDAIHALASRVSAWIIAYADTRPRREPG